MSNNYNTLAASYKKTDAKPDKQYSILPTVLNIVGDLSGLTVVDLGCGSGFFSRVFADQASLVIGIDNSSEQIKTAGQDSRENIDYRLADIMEGSLPASDVVVAPFVLGYCSGVEELKMLFLRIYESLNVGGRFVGVVDLPSGEDLKKFGATKILHGDGDESKIEIILSDGLSPICTLWAVYFSPHTIEKILREVGFKDVRWSSPIISSEGRSAMPPGFWDGYIDNSELGYFLAK